MHVTMDCKVFVPITNQWMQSETFKLRVIIPLLISGAVIASPLTEKLRDAIKLYASQVDGSVTRLYSGVHANFSNGDFYSSEGKSALRISSWSKVCSDILSNL